MARLAKISADAASLVRSPSVGENQIRTSEDDDSALARTQPGSLAVRRAVTKPAPRARPTSLKLSSTASPTRDTHRPTTLSAIKLPPTRSLTSRTQHTWEDGGLRIGAELSGSSDVDSDDTTDLSGFIVSDSVSIYEEDEEEESEEEANPTEAIKTPRPARRLVRGRRPAITDDDSDEELNTRMKQLTTTHRPPITPRESTEKIEAPRPDRTPPRSARPQAQLLASPTKKPPIPAPPYASHSDAFWAPDVINEWNEAYSPVKKKAREPASRPISAQPPPTTDKTARATRRAFSATKQAKAEAFLAELDDQLTQGQVARLAAPTGGVRITWSKNLTSTAGRAHWKRETLPKDSTTMFRHHASIELADKVIDDEHRLLNVVAHEFCHLATFMVSGVRDRPHGREFRAWAAQCARHFGARGVRVTTRHNYAITYKYVWTCVACGHEVQRHSKSIDPARQACGSCHGRLQQTKPPPRTTVSDYQLFVREHLPKLRLENPTSPQKEILGLVAKRYHDAKTYRRQAEMAGASNAEENDKVEDEIEVVARKLNMIDLTSPEK